MIPCVYCPDAAEVTKIGISALFYPSRPVDLARVGTVPSLSSCTVLLYFDCLLGLVYSLQYTSVRVFLSVFYVMRGYECAGNRHSAIK